VTRCYIKIIDKAPTSGYNTTNKVAIQKTRRVNVKKLSYVFVLVLSAFLLSAFGTGCKSSSPSAPNSSPTPVTVTVTGNVTMPALQAGKTLQVSFYSSLTDLSKPDNSFTTACTGTVMAYSLTVSAGSYYAVAVVATSYPGRLVPVAGDYVGVYGKTWPAWPASPNALVSATNSAFDLSLSTAANNVSGTITIPADKTGKIFYVILDQDTSPGTQNWTAIEMETCPSGTAIPYGMVAVVPGTYYLYGAVVSSMAPPSTGDYFGFYGVSSPYYAPPLAPNVTIDISTPATFNFMLGILP
jgi:hypothetical protein